MQNTERIAEIEKISSNLSDKVAEIEIFWKNELKSFPVFKVPLSLLLFNPYNGRIASSIKTFEKHKNRKILINNDEDQSHIETLIWESKEASNKKTLQNLKERGQMIPATITKDGVLIDGNRRAMLLNRLQESYIKTIVLPVTLEEDPIAIQELEYEYQIAVDEKVDYNPIEKYIKAKDLYDRYRNKGVGENKILSDLARLNGKSPKNHSYVKELLDTYDLMTDYLKSIGSEGYLVLLEKKEDLFLTLRNWQSIFLEDDGSNKESRKGFEGYDEVDVADLKDLSFDFIRAEVEGKSFRRIASGNSGNHIFSIKSLWDSFRSKHIEIVKNGDFDFRLDENSSTYIEDLKSKNKKFISTYKTLFEENLENYVFKLDEKKYSDEPNQKLDKFIDLLDKNEIKKKIHSRDSQETIQQLKEVNRKTSDNLKTKPLEQLNSILDQLINVETDFINENEIVEFEEKLNQINKLIFQLKKKL